MIKFHHNWAKQENAKWTNILQSKQIFARRISSLEVSQEFKILFLRVEQSIIFTFEHT